MLTAHGATHPGRIRKINQDTFLCDLDEALFVVGDGMGGHQAGEVASKLAVEAIRVFLARTRNGEKVTWPYGIDPALSFDGNRLATAMRLANRRVFKASETSEEYIGMGTTVVVALAGEGHIVFSSVGDSRIYSFAQGVLTQLTQDDSWITMLMTKGTLDPAAIERHPMKHVLTNVVGARDHLECVVSERVLDGQETFLLCSDGLHGTLDRSTIEGILRSHAAPAVLAETLVGEALERGGNDNITALVVRYEP
jgi:PPM family protein phosphatase